MADRTTRVRLEAVVSPFVTAMAEAGLATQRVVNDLKELSHTSAQTAQKLQPLGTAMLGVGAAFAGGVGLAVKASIDFESAMRNANSIMGQSEEQFGRTSDSVRALSRELPQTATDLSRGLYDIASSGFQGADALEVLKQAATAATAGLSDTATASSAIVGALNAYGLSAQDAADVSDILFATVDKGVISFPELASGMGQWVGTAQAAGVSLAEASAALATMTVNGVDAAEAGTSLNMALLAFVSPGEAMSAALHQIGFNSGVAALGALGLEGTMRKLSDAGFDNVEALQALFPENRALRGAFALNANEGRKFAEIVGEITDKEQRSGSTTRAFAEQSKSAAVQIRLLVNNLTDLAIGFGSALLPALKVVTDLLGDLVAGFRELPQPVQQMAAVAAVLAGTITLLGGGFLFLLPRIQATQLAFATLAAETPMLAAGLRGVMIAAGGIGALLAIASAAVVVFGASSHKSSQDANDFASALQAQADGAKDAVRALVAKKIVDQDLDKLAKTLGLSTKDVAGAILGQADALAKVNKESAAARTAFLPQNMTGIPVGSDEWKALRDRAFAARDLSGAVDELGGSLGTERDKAYRTAEGQKALGVETDKTATSFDTATTALDTFTKALDAYLGKTMSVPQAAEDWRSGLIDLATQLRDNGGALDDLTATGLDNRRMMQDQVQAAADWVKSMVEQGASQAEIEAGLRTMATQLVETATKYGAPIDQAQHFADIILGIPTSTTTKVNVETKEAEAALDRLENRFTRILGLPNFNKIASLLVGGLPDSNAPKDVFGTPLPSGASGASGLPGVPTGPVAPRPPSDKDSGADFLEALWRQRMEIIENQFKAGAATLDEYEASLDEQMAHEVPWTSAWVALQEKKADAIHYWSDQVGIYLHAVQDHEREVQDNMFEVGDISNDRYLEILKERLAGLEMYSDAWMAVWRDIKQLEGDTLDSELKIIAAVEKQRQFDKAFYESYSQRQLTPASSYGSSSVTYNTRNFAPTLNAYGSDATSAMTTQNQKLRDLATVL